MTTSHSDDSTVESWRTEPRHSRLQTLEVEDLSIADAPALWKDIAFATIMAILLWMSAAAFLM